MDFRLRVFLAVAHNLNFTKAAHELHISQPAVSKHIQEIETAFGVQLFERSGNRITITAAGGVYMKHAELIIESYRQLEHEMNLLSGNFSGTLRIGASTTIAQYVLPTIIARFIARFAQVRITMLTGNSEQIEQALDEHRIDLGMVEGSSRRHGLKYTHFANDELVMATSNANKIKEEVTLQELTQLPLVLRESGSGTLEVIENALAEHQSNISQMNILLQMGSTEAIKSFLVSSPSTYAIISIAALTKELLTGCLKVVELTNMELKREFVFVIQQGSHNEIAERFMEFSKVIR